MNAETKLDLLDQANRPASRHVIPSSKLYLITESAEQHWLARLERWIKTLRGLTVAQDSETIHP